MSSTARIFTNLTTDQRYYGEIDTEFSPNRARNVESAVKKFTDDLKYDRLTADFHGTPAFARQAFVQSRYRTQYCIS